MASPPSPQAKGKYALCQLEVIETILKVVAVTSLAMLVLGLPFTCHGGIHMFNVFNESVNILMGIALTINMDNMIRSEFIIVEIPQGSIDYAFRLLHGTFYFLHSWRFSWCPGYMVLTGLPYHCYRTQVTQSAY